MTIRIISVVLTLLMAATLAVNAHAEQKAGHAQKASAERHQKVGNLDIYYGILPARIVGQHDKAHDESTMHGGALAQANDYHLVVAIFNKDGQRVSNATVQASVSELGAPESRKILTPMKTGEFTSFGNYFSFRRAGIYRIVIEVKRPDAHEKSLRAIFDYRFQ